MGIDKLPIEKSVDLNLQYPTVSDRYFSHHYFVPKNPFKKTMIKGADVKNGVVISDTLESQCVNNSGVSSEAKLPLRGEDTCIMMHSNRICVVALPHNHPVLSQKKDISKVDFKVGGMDRLANKVSGKGKRGAQILGMFSPLCCLHCTDGSSYTVFTGVHGKLIEVNDRLLETPNLISEAPKAEGYLAVVLPKLNQGDNLKELLLTSDQYEALYSGR